MARQALKPPFAYYGGKYCPARFCDRVDHTECWSEYDRQENEYKYRRATVF